MEMLAAAVGGEKAEIAGRGLIYFLRETTEYSVADLRQVTSALIDGFEEKAWETSSPRGKSLVLDIIFAAARFEPDSAYAKIHQLVNAQCHDVLPDGIFGRMTRFLIATEFEQPNFDAVFAARRAHNFIESAHDLSPLDVALVPEMFRYLAIAFSLQIGDSILTAQNDRILNNLADRFFIYQYSRWDEGILARRIEAARVSEILCEETDVKTLQALHSLIGHLTPKVAYNTFSNLIILTKKFGSQSSVTSKVTPVVDTWIKLCMAAWQRCFARDKSFSMDARVTGYRGCENALENSLSPDLQIPDTVSKTRIRGAIQLELAHLKFERYLLLAELKEYDFGLLRDGLKHSNKTRQFCEYSRWSAVEELSLLTEITDLRDKLEALLKS